MSFSTPTTKQINDEIIAQLEAELNQSIPLMPKSFLRVVAKVFAGMFMLLYKYNGFMHLQQFVQTATLAETEINGVVVSPLKFWGRTFGAGDPVPATRAQAVIEVTVVNQSGSLPNGSQLTSAINGHTYITLNAVLLDAPAVSVEVRAVSDQAGGDGSGAAGNLQPGDALSFVSPLSNVSQEAVVIAQTVTGADGESEEAYRSRILDKAQKTPQGGAYSDYEQWGEEVSGIINVYPYTSSCPGQVNVYSEATEESSGSVDGVPTTAQLQAVLDSINQDESGRATRRPVGALAISLPITRKPFTVTVTGLNVDDPAGVQEEITEALEEYFSEREPYIPGLSIPPRMDRITATSVAGVVEDITAAAGGIFSGTTLASDGAPVTTYTLGEGEKSKLDGVTFI